MTLQASGIISMYDINIELNRAGGTAFTLNDSDARTLAQVPSGQIAMSNFYGKSNVTPSILVGGGSAQSTNTNPFTTTRYYILSSGTRTTTTALNAARHLGAGWGSTSISYFWGCTAATLAAVNTTSKYTWVGATWVAGGALNVTRAGCGATGTSTMAAVAFTGNNYSPAAVNATTSIYTFSSDSAAAGTAMATGRGTMGACSTGTVGKFGGGMNASSTQYAVVSNYTFSNNAYAAGTALNAARAASCGGNTTQGVWAGSYTSNTSTTSKQLHSNNTSSAGGALGVTSYASGGASDASNAWFFGGWNNIPNYTTNDYMTNVRIYSHSANTTSAGTALDWAGTGGCIACSNNNSGII